MCNVVVMMPGRRIRKVPKLSPPHWTKPLSQYTVVSLNYQPMLADSVHFYRIRIQTMKKIGSDKELATSSTFRKYEKLLQGKCLPEKNCFYARTKAFLTRSDLEPDPVKI
jgi:hypothetical protein